MVKKLPGATHHRTCALTQHSAFLTGCAGCHLTQASLTFCAKQLHLHVRMLHLSQKMDHHLGKAYPKLTFPNIWEGQVGGQSSLVHAAPMPTLQPSIVSTAP